VAVDRHVYIYEPTPSKKDLVSGVDYKWMKVASILFSAEVVCISWNCDDNRLLVALQNGCIQVWAYNSNLHGTTAAANHTHSSGRHHPHSHAHSHYHPVQQQHAPKMSDQPVKFSIEEEDADMLQNEEVKHECSGGFSWLGLF
jgi:hypothetical protein